MAPRKLPHVTYVGTNSILFAAINWLKLPSYIALGVMTHEVLVAALMLLPLAAASTLVSIRMLRRLKPDRFYHITYWLMVFLGAKLVWSGLF